jgi:hypothetical protein
MSHKFLNINWELFDKQSEKNKEQLKLMMQNTNENNNTNESNNTNNNNTRPFYYFLPPANINSNLYYQDINKDKELRLQMTHFYLQKTIKWVNNYNEFKFAKKLLSKLKKEFGYKLIYNILRQFIKKYNYNWYDLKTNYDIVKDYIRYKLNKNLTS